MTGEVSGELGKIMRLLSFRQEQSGMSFQAFVDAGGSGFGSPDQEKMWAG